MGFLWLFDALRVTARNRHCEVRSKALQIDGLDLFRNEILQKSFKNPCDSKFFVYLPLIVRGEMLCIRRSHIRAVEGNLCLYPRKQNLENFENGYKIRLTSLICIYHL